MAFTNPILAGEELNRTGIRSENYVPGVSGWRVANDGAAEFDNIGVRHQLWCPDIIYQGQQLSTYWANAVGGIKSWIRGYPVTATTTEAQIFLTRANLRAGRMYEVSLMNCTPDITSVKSTEYRLRYTLSETTPDNSSQLMALSLRLSQFELGQIRSVFVPATDTVIQVRASIASLDGANVRNWCPGDGGVLNVTEIGVAPPQVGTVGTGLPTRTLKEWTITANASKTYLGDGSWRNDAVYIDSMVMGDWANGKGNQRAWWTFSTSDVNNFVNDLLNVPLADYVILEVRLAAAEWKQSNQQGYLSLGYHGTTNSLPGSFEPGGGIPNTVQYFVIGNNANWYGILPGGGVPSSFTDSLKSGYLKGFMVGNTFGGAQYCGILSGALMSNPPQLHAKYYKSS